MPVSQRQIKIFQKRVIEFYREHKRDLPWRNTKDPYRIFISEVMLQQTQVNRVIQKYDAWLKIFPDFETLAHSNLSQILNLWSGLGYNRRAKFLIDSAKTIFNEWNSTIPKDPEILVKLPGIGKATAASIIVFSYNEALVFIETNIRRVFIHEFFKDKSEISDLQIFPLVSQTLDPINPREWYYALMDYGSYLAKTIPNPNRHSKNYSKQSIFSGSSREVRGEILRILSNSPMTISDLEKEIIGNKKHFETALNQLLQESFLEKRNDTIQINDHD